MAILGGGGIIILGLGARFAVAFRGGARFDSRYGAMVAGVIIGLTAFLDIDRFAVLGGARFAVLGGARFAFRGGARFAFRGGARFAVLDGVIGTLNLIW